MGTKFQVGFSQLIQFKIKYCFKTNKLCTNEVNKNITNFISDVNKSFTFKLCDKE